MKKSLLFVSLFSIGLISFAQNKTATSPVKVYQPKNVKAMPAPKKNFNGSEISEFTQATQTPIPAMKHNPNPVPTSTTVIGSSTYNLGTNSSVRNAYVRSSDGTESAVFTLSTQPSAYSDRGTGYNYYSSGSWGAVPTSRVETSRTGWPSVATFSDGSEMCVSHNTALGQTFLFRRPVKGTGTWTVQ